MRKYLGAFAAFALVMVTGLVGMKLMHPHRSLGSLVRGEERDVLGDTAVVYAAGDPAAECRAVPERTVGFLRQGLNEGVTLRIPRAWWAGNFSRAYFIAAELDGPGLEGDGHVATWSITSLTLGDGTEVMAEDDLAAQHSRFPDARVTDDFDRSMFASSLSYAGDCVRAEEAAP